MWPDPQPTNEEIDVVTTNIEPTVEQMSLFFGRQKEVETEEEKSPLEAKVPSSQPLEVQEDSFVETGDEVLISYHDEPTLQHTIMISATEHDPDLKIIRADMPLAKALVNAEINEEVEIAAGGKVRTVTIIGIEKATKRAYEAA
jgi:transcription elongation GreA/GreB family factor